MTETSLCVLMLQDVIPKIWKDRQVGEIIIVFFFYVLRPSQNLFLG